MLGGAGSVPGVVGVGTTGGGTGITAGTGDNKTLEIFEFMII